MKQLLIALKATLVLTLLTGVMYPVLVTGLAKVLFRDKADGSLIQANGRTVGSELIGQRFTKPGYFHGRPSAAGNDGYDGLSSGGSNLGPTSQKLADRVTADVKTFRAENPTFSGAVPGDAVTASGSGLDPHLSPEAVDAQVPRVAAARGMTAEALRQLVAAHTENRQIGVLGEPRVNVLKLNLALDDAAPLKK
jgi:K+-transporting ATPase ATPase C chain